MVSSSRVSKSGARGGFSSGMETMNRNVVTAVVVSLVLVGLALFFIFRGRDRDAVPPSAAEVAGAPAGAGAEGARAGDPGAAVAKTSPAGEARKKDQPAPEDRGPPLLRG